MPIVGTRWSCCFNSCILLGFLLLSAAVQLIEAHKPKDSKLYKLRPGQTERGQNITHILNSFFTKGYDKRVRPNYGGPPVKVGVSMQIVSISAVSEVQMDFTSDFYFRQSWRDERLSFPRTNELSQMTVGAEVAGKIWVPDTFFANEKTAYFHIATTPNTFLRIGSDGDVYRSIRLTVTASCPMDLRYFPMDRQSCTIEIESFGYTMSDIRYSWRDGAKSVGISEEVQLPQFKIQGHVQKASEISLSTGNYSRLICEIRFVRSMGYYLIQIYVPAGLIVVISWVSFWLHRNATPARVALGVMTVLTMTTLMSSTNSQLPKISYVKSIDVYLGTCFVMVFASLLEYAAVGYLGKRVAMRKSRAQQLARFQDRKRTQRVMRQFGPSMDEMSPEHDPLITKNYNFNFNQAPWGGGATSAPAPMPAYNPRYERKLHIASAPKSVHHGGRESGKHLDLNSGSIKPHGKHHSSEKSKNNNQDKVDEIENQIRSEYYSSSNPGRPTQIGHGNLKLSSSSARNVNNYYNTINGKHHQQLNSMSNNPTSMMNSYNMINHNGPPTSHYATMPHLVNPRERRTDHLNNSIINPLVAMDEHRLSRCDSKISRKASTSPEGSIVGGALSPAVESVLLKNPNKLCGVNPSDIDKYSRVVFPVCFVCFNLMYWVIYMRISDVKYAEPTVLH
ncbi:gamma-aminobutyric acid receptor subunit beta [Galendromus occidentalis]|uniref:Gamma-aminobutyric acid receptor subunit beta n=1 Tax=Galendromus occidentalis TaxID=34638 RepID=A0AAJ7SF28_9ACAR|nr:gamma-aminobutyric acid receptor subunit beta [Galendromus occidentalis]